MKIQLLEPMSVFPNIPLDNNGCINPFHQEPELMGIRIGTNAMVMMKNFEGERCKFLDVVDTGTGQRVRIFLHDIFDKTT